ncbi:MAG: DedA family protein [Hyphomicrobiaceae bacterium]
MLETLRQTITGYIDTLLAFVHTHDAFAEPLVFVLGFAESVPVLAFFAPSTVILVALGAAEGANGQPFWHLWLAASAGAFCGDCFVYVLGRTFEQRILHWPVLARHPEWWRHGHNFFERWGMLGILGGKFLGPLRSALPLIAGVVEMPAWKFLPASLASSLLWAGVFLAPGIFGLGWLMGSG